MVGSLTTRSSGRLVVVGTARPEFLETHLEFAPSGEVTVALRPLTEAQSERLVTELLGDSDPLQALLMDVRQKADGNPFFLEEILQRLIDEGALVRQDGGVATERAQDVRRRHDPRSARGAHRRAARRGKGLLQQAAVVRIFWPGSLTAAANGRDPGPALARAARTRLCTTQRSRASQSSSSATS